MSKTQSDAQSTAHKHPDPKQAGQRAAASGAQVGQNASAQARMKAEIEKRSSQGADELSEVARALHQSGRDLEGNVAGPYVQKAAEQIDHISDYLRTAEPREFVESVVGFAKRDPVLFLSGAFALGLFGSRFMKSGEPSAPQSTTRRAKVRKGTRRDSTQS